MFNVEAKVVNFYGYKFFATINLYVKKYTLTLHYKVLLNQNNIMAEQEQHLKNLAEIRSIMERTTTFISLSGLSGIFAGLFAIIGAYAAYRYFGYEYNTANLRSIIFTENGNYNVSFLWFCLIDGGLILALALFSGVFFSIRKAKKSGAKIWDKSAQRLLINLLIPLISGALFALILIYHKQVLYISAISLIFYGLALINADKYTLSDVRYLGIAEILTGLLSALYIGYGLIFWTIGFGVLHIVYGIVMYYKYDR